MKKCEYKVAFEKYTHLLSSELDKRYMCQEFEFSGEFDLRMQKLFETQKKSHAPMFGRWGMVAAVLCLVAVLISFPHIGGFFKEPQGNFYVPQGSYPAPNNSVEDMQKLKKIEVPSDYAEFDGLEEMINSSDCIVVATAKESLFEGEQYWRDSTDKKTDNFNKLDFEYSYTKRNLEVSKVYKGEEVQTPIILREKLITDGERLKYLSGEYPIKKSEKYLLFLYKSETENEYYAFLYQGKCDFSGEEIADKEMYNQIKEFYKSEF